MEEFITWVEQNEADLELLQQVSGHERKAILPHAFRVLRRLASFRDSLAREKALASALGERTPPCPAPAASSKPCRSAMS